ncbi:MAG: aminomethyl-transferring glycine dehydrogenase subunit GcvPB [Phycisphaerales bacterium]|nr:aminomethyl-transferring glycine dehydrogenase subunit GcvPB [Phycisphaerales bacterium]
MSSVSEQTREAKATPSASRLPAETRGRRVPERTIFEKSTPGARAIEFPPLDVDETPVPADLRTEGTPWPELSQLQVIRHYPHLSQRNFSIDGEFYPLGSCTMKYNPRINEWAASRPGLASLHPLQDDDDIQGALELLYRTRRMLEEISGLDEASLQPAAGAHGEYTALKVMRAYFNDHGQTQRDVVLAPDTAHGTNPASCAMCGAGVINVPTVDGYTDIDALRRIIDEQGAANIAGFMITNPNTAGLFDSRIIETAEIIHDAGGLIYLDGANMNAILGKALPRDFGVDVMHYNVHKTFSTPHGCGGPGGGPIVVRDFLAPYLPQPQVTWDADADRYSLNHDMPKSIGKVRSFITQFGIMVRCWTYIAACGPDGLRNIAETAVINANYLASRLRHRYEMPYFRPEAGAYAAHEFITVPRSLLERGIKLDDIAKRLIDYGIHPPTMHWPVINCLMVEPTDTEPKNVLDRFVDVMLRIADEIESDTEVVRQAPHDAPTRRIDVVGSDRKPRLVSEL